MCWWRLVSEVIYKHLIGSTDIPRHFAFCGTQQCDKNVYHAPRRTKFLKNNFKEKKPRRRNRYRQRNSLILGLKKEKFEEVH